MSDLIALEFGSPAPRLSMNDRRHWRARAKIVRVWRHATKIYAQQAQLGELPPSRVGIVFGVGDPNRRRDPSNYYPTLKAVIDGLVDAGCWPDDDSRYVETVEPRFEAHKSGRLVRVEIMPREAS